MNPPSVRTRARRRPAKQRPTRRKSDLSARRTTPTRRWRWFCDAGALVFLVTAVFLVRHPIPADILGMRLIALGCVSALFFGVCAFGKGCFDRWRFLYWFLPLLLLGLGIRLLIASIAPGHGSDLGINERWMRSATLRGVPFSYTKPLEGGVPNYPPFSLMIFALVGHVIQWLFPAGLAVGQHTVRIFLRLPSIGTDLMTALTLALIVGRVFSRRAAIAAAAIYLFHPAVLFETAVWGQTDSIHTFLLLAAFAAVFWRFWLLTGILFALAVLTKAQAVILAPLFLLLCLRDWKAMGKLFIGGALSVFAVLVPFVVQHSVREILHVYTGSVGHFPKLSMNAFNLWWALFGKAAGKMRDTDLAFSLLSYRSISIVLFAAAIAIVLWMYRKPLVRPDRSASLLRTGALTASWIIACFFLLNTEMHERYLFPLVAFGLPLAFFDRRALMIYGAMTVLFFVNLTGAHHFNWLDRWLYDTFPEIGRTIAFLQLFLFAWLLQYALDTVPRNPVRAPVKKRVSSLIRFFTRWRSLIAMGMRRCWGVLSSPVTLFWMILVIGIAVRIYRFGTVPPGLNQDEGSVAYDAYALLHYGIERNGLSFPIVLPGYGSGFFGTISAYLSMPFIAVWGLNVASARAFSLVASIVALFTFYFFLRKYTDRMTAITGLFVLALNPWNIMMARWGLDENAFATLFLLGTFFLCLSFSRPRWFIAACVFFGLSLYAHGTAFFIMPFFFAGYLTFLLWKRQSIFPSGFLGILIFVLIALPIFLCLVTNEANLSTLKLGPLTIPRLPTHPHYRDVSSIFSGSVLHDLSGNAKTLWTLLFYQKERHLWNAIPGYGYMFLFNTPLAIFGLFLALKSLFVRKNEAFFLIVLWFFVSVALGLLMSVNINRITIIFFPILFFLTLGIAFFRRWKVVFLSLLLANGIAFANFTQNYFNEYPQKIGPQFYESLDEAIAFASRITDGKVCITRKGTRMPEVTVLFTEKIDPHEFLQTVVYENPTETDRRVKSFDRYVFGVEQCLKSAVSVFVIHNDEQKNFSGNNFNMKQFKYFSVARRKASSHR